MNVKSEPGATAWPLLLRAQAEIVADIERRLDAANLPPLAWYDVLWTLEQAPDQALRMSALAEALVVSRSHLSHLIGRLEAARLVSRRMSTEDGRGTVAVLTDRGVALRSSMWPAYLSAIEAQFTRHLRPADARTLAAILRRLLASRRRHASSTGPQ